MYLRVAGFPSRQFKTVHKKQKTGLVVCIFFIALTSAQQIFAQGSGVLNLSDAVKTGLNNYQSIKARSNYIKASQALVQQVKNQYLPDVIGSLQQAYGTVNGQFGALAPIAGTVASSGPTYSSQSWNAAFGSVYLVNVNWEFVSFGRLHSRIQAAQSQVGLDSANLLQEQFVQSVKISGTYLNLLIARRFILNAQANVDRATYVQQSVLARAKSGLIAGVDSSIANAEVSGARLAMLQAVANEQRIRNQLVQLINTAPEQYAELDSSFFSNTPSNYNTSVAVTDNPQVKFYQSRIDQSATYEKFLRKSINPGVNLFGTFQGRGSGFDYNYTPDFTDRYSKSYLDGAKPERYNYLLGVGITWNFMSPFKIKQQVKSQSYISAAYRDEYDLVLTQLKDQLVLSDQQIEISLKSIQEAPFQLKAAQDAYLQKTVLYKNGLANIVDVQQALFTLNRAQTDISVAYINIWQALLLKAAASGDFDLFIKQVK
ncbi:MAG: TolC family protein [Chitinophagaceae bacterium]